MSSFPDFNSYAYRRETVTEDRHPLLAALDDMQNVQATQRGLKVLGRIKTGIENRVRWIDNRQQQIDRLTAIQQLVLDAYDAKDTSRMANLLREVEGIVSMSEANSPLEDTIEETIAEAEVLDEDMSPPEGKRHSRVGKRGYGAVTKRDSY